MRPPLCKTSDSSGHLILLALLYDNLISSVCFMYSHPLHLAYLLYFSPYILQLLSFLFPLLLSTTTLLLLISLHSVLEGESAAVCLLDQLCSVVVATVGNVFEWEFEAMCELYNNSVCLIGDVEDENFAAEISVENQAVSEALQPNAGNGERAGSKGASFELNCEDGGDERSEILDSDHGNGVQANSTGCSFVPQTPDRTTEILSGSPLARRAKQRSGAFESLSRSGFMRARSMRITSGNPEKCPDEMFWECSERIELSKSRSEKGRSLERDGSGSARKEKEWKRTLGCKLYEERMTFKLRDQEMPAVVDGAEEMDLLWEAYESDADKANKSKNSRKNRKNEDSIKEQDADEEDESVAGQVCCLHAFRLSTGKMNLGVGRPNLSRISKVFKGMGSLRRSSSSRSRNN